jgi:acylglycerol lipase
MIDSIPYIKTIDASDGYRLHYRHWAPEADRQSPPVGYVIGLHGIQSHSGWYEYSSQRLCQAGFDVRFFDRRGSGLNTLDRGHVEHYERLTNDVVQAIGLVRNERDKTRSNVPIILLAVSWGAKIATVVAAQRPDLVERLVLLYPGLCPSVNANWRQLQLLSLATATGQTRRLIKIPLDDPSLFTGEARWQRFIVNDPHAVHDVSVSLLKAGRAMDKIIEESVSHIKCPVRMVLAGDDKIIDNSRTAELFQRFGSADRSLVEYPGCQHTLEFEPNREQIFDELIESLKLAK